MIVCCKHCYDYLDNLNSNASKSWTNLCERFVREKGHFDVKEHFMPGCLPTLRLLEEKRYIKTADALNAVKCHVEGYAYDNGQDTFCIHRDKHIQLKD